MPTLSIVIPVYNERDTWLELLARVETASIPGIRRQVILIEDGSSDGTRQQLEDFRQRLVSGQVQTPSDLTHKIIFHERNHGKGAALRTGFASANGDVVIVQDADHEYDPREYAKVIAPILAGQADASYGSRFTSGKPQQALLANYVANRVLTGLANLVTGLHLTDMETCYKAFSRDILQKLNIEQNRFGFEPEVTIKLASLRARIAQMPISYVGRTKAQGKKIGLKDGVDTLWCILKYGVLRRLKRV